VAEPLWWPVQLTAWVDRVDAQWCALGMTRDQRARLRQELVRDLGQAVLGGAAPAELMRADPDHFARDVLDAEGIDLTATSTIGAEPRWVGRARLVVTALTGAAAAGMLALVTVYPIGSALMDNTRFNFTQGLIALATHVVAATMAAAGGALAVGWSFGSYRHPRRLALASGVGLVVSGGVAALLAVGYAGLTHYSTQASVELTEVMIVTLVCALGVIATSSLVPVERLPDGETGKRRAS